ncbi:MAG: hypothetical protein M3452_08895 [Chloroflexota bacterium]|nr:hypothetical protein [Chloroflexota bacterium]
MSPRTRQRAAFSLRDVLVTASQAALFAVLLASVAFAFSEPGPHGYAILIIGLPSFILGPALLIGYLLWVLGRTGRVMLFANAPVALFSGWLAGAMVTEGVGDAAAPEFIVAVVAALVASITGIVAALRWPGPGPRRMAA